MTIINEQLVSGRAGNGQVEDRHDMMPWQLTLIHIPQSSFTYGQINAASVLVAAHLVNGQSLVAYLRSNCYAQRATTSPNLRYNLKTQGEL